MDVDETHHKIEELELRLSCIAQWVFEHELDVDPLRTIMEKRGCPVPSTKN